MKKTQIFLTVIMTSLLLFLTISSSIIVSAAYPRQRNGHAMIYDSVNDRVIMYGGEYAINYANWIDDTWEYNFNTNEWIKLTPTEKPYGKISTEMAYDSESELIVHFGGSHQEDYASNQTWVYDYSANTWTDTENPDGVRLRYDHCMVYDSESDKVIMFGGGLFPDYNPFGDYILYNDTWAYDTNTNVWTNMTPAVTPVGRIGAQMVYDSESDRIIMFGGAEISGTPFTEGPEVYKTETWAYDYNTNLWENITPGFSPDPRLDHAMAYDSTMDKVILFGGYTHLDTDGMVDETWEFDYNSNTWTELYPIGDISTYAARMVYDSESDRTILFGGNDPDSPYTLLDGTWVFDYTNMNWTLMPIPEVTEENSFFLFSAVSSITLVAAFTIFRRRKK